MQNLNYLNTSNVINKQRDDRLPSFNTNNLNTSNVINKQNT